jgi:hypothetical protein
MALASRNRPAFSFTARRHTKIFKQVVDFSAMTPGFLSRSLAISALVLGFSGGARQAALAAPPHSVTLKWRASPGPVSGYRIYRTEKKGEQRRLIATTAADARQYKDTAVEAGHTYDYAVTAFDQRKRESPSSVTVRVTVPAP